MSPSYSVNYGIRYLDLSLELYYFASKLKIFIIRFWMDKASKTKNKTIINGTGYEMALTMNLDTFSNHNTYDSYPMSHRFSG